MLRSARTLFTVLAAGALVVMMQSPALAVDGYQETHAETPSGQQADNGCDPDKGEQIRRGLGIACFFRYGDDFWINDRLSDGMSVGIQWRLTDGSRHGLIRDKLGQGVDTMLRKEFPQDATLMWRMGRCNETATNNCRQGADYQDWGIYAEDCGFWECEGGAAKAAFCTPVGPSGSARVCTWP